MGASLHCNVCARWHFVRSSHWLIHARTRFNRSHIYVIYVRNDGKDSSLPLLFFITHIHRMFAHIVVAIFRTNFGLRKNETRKLSRKKWVKSKFEKIDGEIGAAIKCKSVRCRYQRQYPAHGIPSYIIFNSNLMFLLNQWIVWNCLMENITGLI